MSVARGPLRAGLFCLRHGCAQVHSHISGWGSLGGPPVSIIGVTLIARHARHSSRQSCGRDCDGTQNLPDMGSNVCAIRTQEGLGFRSNTTVASGLCGL